jgi:hypothetical protein
LTARLPALLPGCPAERGAAALGVLLEAAAATGDPVLVEDVTARIAELGGGPGTPPVRPKGTTGTPPAGTKGTIGVAGDRGAKNPAKTIARR